MTKQKPLKVTPRHIRMRIDTYEGTEQWSTLHKFVLSDDQEKRIMAIWQKASEDIKRIVHEDVPFTSEKL